LDVVGTCLRAGLDGEQFFEVDAIDWPLPGGRMALICEGGRAATQAVTVRLANREMEG
jgi:hypothetical protein